MRRRAKRSLNCRTWSIVCTMISDNQRTFWLLASTLYRLPQNAASTPRVKIQQISISWCVIQNFSPNGQKCCNWTFRDKKNTNWLAQRGLGWLKGALVGSQELCPLVCSQGPCLCYCATTHCGSLIIYLLTNPVFSLWNYCLVAVDRGTEWREGKLDVSKYISVDCHLFHYSCHSKNIQLKFLFLFDLKKTLRSVKKKWKLVSFVISVAC